MFNYVNKSNRISARSCFNTSASLLFPDCVVNRWPYVALSNGCNWAKKLLCLVVLLMLLLTLFLNDSSDSAGNITNPFI